MRLKDLVGKTVIDSAGDDLGKIEDIDYDWDTKTITALIISGDYEVKQKFLGSKYAKSIFGRLGQKANPDITVSVDDVRGIGDVVTLSVDIT